MRLGRFRGAMARPMSARLPRFVVILASRSGPGISLTFTVIEASDLSAAERLVREFRRRLDEPLAACEVIPFDSLHSALPHKSMPSPWSWRSRRRSE